MPDLPRFEYDSTPVFIEKPAADIISSPFAKVIGAPSSLTADTVVDSNTINVAAGHSFVADDMVIITGGSITSVYIGTILSINVNELTLDTPINAIFPASSGLVFKATRKLNVNGSVTPQVFSFGPHEGQDWSISRLMFTMLTTGQPDDSKFGDLAALSNGIVLRLSRNGDYRYNLFNIKSNFGFASLAYDITYSASAGPQSEWGVRTRLSYNGEDKHGQPVILNSDTHDALELIIQDDLTDLVEFSIVAEGHVRRQS